MTKKCSTGCSFLLPLSIVIAGLLVAGTLFYLNKNKKPEMTPEQFDQKVEKSIEKYIQKKQDEARKAQEEAMKPKKKEGIETGDNAVLGQADAPVTIIEFSDYECPYCKMGFEKVLSKIKEKYIKTGKVKYVFRDFPMPFHGEIAMDEALASECVRKMSDDEKFYEYHDLIFQNTKSNGGLEKDKLYEFAKTVGVDAAGFKKCLDNKETQEAVDKDIADGKKYGLEGTPAFFINGWFFRGLYPYEKFEEYIENELAAAKK